MRLVLLLLAALLQPVGGVESEVHTLATDGTVALQQGDYETALDLLSRATALDSEYIIAHTNLGITHYRLGDMPQARLWLEKARAMNPVNAGIRVNLGAVYYELGDAEAAVAEFEEAAFLHPEHPDAASNLAAVRGDLANRRFAEGVRLFNEANDLAAAAEQFRLAAEADPSLASAHSNLGVALYELNRRDESIAAFEQALALERHQWDALWALGLAYGEDGRTGDSLRLFRRLVSGGTTGTGQHQYSQRAHFFIAVLLWERGRPEDEPRVSSNLAQTTAFLVDSFQFAVEHAPAGSRLMWGTFAGISAAWAAAPADGLVLEFGVSSGQSLRHIAALAGPARTVYGFDTFTGLPEPWHDVPAGTYSVGGEPPAGIPNAEFVKGLFADTAPRFLREHRGRAAFIHIDCDLYSSARDALFAVGDRVEVGTVILFDELVRHHTWREDEYRALTSAADFFGWEYAFEFISLSSEQGAVVIQSVSS